MYAFPLISRFEMKYREVFKTAFFLANRHILLTIATAILLASTALIALLEPAFILVAAGAYCYFSSFLFVKAFKKYRPDLDLETNIGEIAPMQFDEKVIEEIVEEESQGREYGSESTVLNLERLKGLQEDKE